MPVFMLTEEHLKLMRGLQFYYEDGCEYGGPSVDTKRPFGSSGRTQIILDMARLLGIPEEKVYDSGKEDLTEKEAARIEKLYRELPRAIECVFRTMSFEPGAFEAPMYTVQWKRVER